MAPPWVHTFPFRVYFFPDTRFPLFGSIEPPFFLPLLWSFCLSNVIPQFVFFFPRQFFYMRCTQLLMLSLHLFLRTCLSPLSSVSPPSRDAPLPRPHSGPKAAATPPLFLLFFFNLLGYLPILCPLLLWEDRKWVIWIFTSFPPHGKGSGLPY